MLITTFTSIQLESQIISMLNQNNTKGNTFHFVYDDQTINTKLEIVSCNPTTLTMFLLLEITDISHNACLEKAIEQLKDIENVDYSWKLKWIDGAWVEHISYFYAKTEQEVRNKFHYAYTDNCIIEIEKMPLS
jgi:hypothetical protein